MRTGRIHDNNINDNIKINKIKLKHKLKMIIWLFLAIIIIYQNYKLVMYTIGKKEKDEMWLYNGVNKVINIFVKEEKHYSYEDHTLKFACIGDIYATNDIINSSKKGSSYDFSKGYENIKEKLEKYDFVTASLSTPIADKSLGYSNKNVYNAPVNILDTLKYLSISIVATATNHAYDKKEIGISSTIENLKNASIKQIGISEDSTRKDPIIVSKNEINIGILSYATNSNIKIPKDKEYLVNILNEENVKKDMEFLNSKNVDYIIAYLNDPNEDSLLTSSDQKKNVEMLFSNGINVVLGTGSMVVQGQIEDQIQIDDKNSNHVYSIYSLGDFLGKYENDDNKTSVIADIEFSKRIKKDRKGNIKDTIVDMKVNKPLFLWTNLNSNTLRTMYIIEDEMNLYEKDKSTLSSKQYQKLVQANDRLEELFK